MIGPTGLSHNPEHLTKEKVEVEAFVNNLMTVGRHLNLPGFNQDEYTEYDLDEKTLEILADGRPYF